MVDGQGRKMSKSVGNVIAPQKVSDSLGAEILRLWVASTDYSGELSISDEILKRVVEGYRRIRNTLRFLLANLADFDAVSQAVPHGELFEIDRYALAMTAQMQAEISAHYERYDFHPAVSRLQTFCSEDLGAFYLDILKDRLYTTAAGSLARRSAQTALLEITQALLKLMAPILSFTAEEAWKELVASALKHQADAARVTIFTEVFHSLPPYADAEALTAKWTRLRAIRAEVQRKLEEVRTAGDIGSSLQAEVDLYAASADQELLASLGDDLRFVLIVSRATVHAGEGETRIEVTPSQHKKCERCWHWRLDVGQDADHPEICGRCVSNLFGAVKPAARPEHGRPRRPRDAGPAAAPHRRGSAAGWRWRCSSSSWTSSPRSTSTPRSSTANGCICCRSSTSRWSTTEARRSVSWRPRKAGNAGSSPAWAARRRWSSSGCCVARPASRASAWRWR